MKEKEINMIIKPKETQVRGGTAIITFLKEVDLAISEGSEITLDLSEVPYMDTTGFRAVFDRLPKFKKVIPPKNQHIVDMYNTWLDSKKGLSKGYVSNGQENKESSDLNVITVTDEDIQKLEDHLFETDEYFKDLKPLRGL
jgi:hypothetical protein